MGEAVEGRLPGVLAVAVGRWGLGWRSGGAAFRSPSVGSCATSLRSRARLPQVIIFYVVASPPTATITTPANGGVYGLASR